MRTAARGLALAILPVIALTGCGFKGAQSFPLPGGVATGNDAYVVKVEFSDVLDLVPQSSVKVNDVTVGSVSDIILKDSQTAEVTVRIRKDVSLPQNTAASLRQTSLLGEKFVSLDAPAKDKASGVLRSGDVIPLDRTTRNAEVEEVLSALSLVLNGGSLEQLQVINKEVVQALKGREPQIKDLLTQLNTFVGGLDNQKADIVRALNSLDRLTARLAAQRSVLATALADLPDGARILADQRTNLTQLVTGLDRLSGVSVRVINASQQNTVADLKALQPILAGLNAAGTSLPGALELLATYPFPKTLASGIRGDYANLFATVDVRSLLTQTPGLPVPSGLAGAPGTPPLPTLALGAPRLGVPAVPGPRKGVLPAVPGLTGGASPGGGSGSGSGSLTQLLLGGMQ